MPNTWYFFLLVSQTVPAQPIFSSDTWHTASGLEDNKRSGNQTPTTTKMVAGKTSIAEELLQSISLHQMRAIPAYLSESDATTIEAFAKSELSLTYVLDTQNLYWPGKDMWFTVMWCLKCTKQIWMHGPVKWYTGKTVQTNLPCMHLVTSQSSTLL